MLGKNTPFVYHAIICTMPYQPQEPWRRLMLRTKETAETYAQFQAENRARKEAGEDMHECAICADTKAVIEEYTHWVRMKNAFPYDRHFTQSDMLALKRHSDETGITQEERAELIELKKKLADTYDHILENLPKQQSIPHHYHVHLVTFPIPPEASPTS
jgi:hypothetical protein